MSKLRQAALLVHGLGRADQDWLFSQLDASDELVRLKRTPLMAALSELENLGIPRDAELIEAVLASEADNHARLSRAPASLVLRALEGQAIEAVALLLSLHPWPWRQAVIAQLSVEFQARPTLLRKQDGTPGRALQAALIDAVAERLERVRDDVALALPGQRSASAGRTRRRSRWLPWRRASS